ncbi:hypothetical protein U9R90_36415, partial [Streptomyces sp. E11-3]
RGWRELRVGAGVYAVGVVLTYFVASPIGTNVERLALLGAPAVLLAALLAPGVFAPGVFASGLPASGLPASGLPAPPGARWFWLVRGVALAVAFVFSVNWVAQKTVDDVVTNTAVPAWAADADGVLAALDRLGAERTRVEVVPSRDHREASLLAPHINMARGWNRQADVERGRLFYDGYEGARAADGAFSAAAYRAWLDRWAVGLVVLPEGEPDGPAAREAALVRSGPGWLEPVWRDANWRVFRVRDAVPLVSRPGAVLRSDGTSLVVRVPRAAVVTVRVAYSPWLRVDGGCLAREGEFTRLTVR